jgi:hypothetical protein
MVHRFAAYLDTLRASVNSPGFTPLIPANSLRAFAMDLNVMEIMTWPK